MIAGTNWGDAAMLHQVQGGVLRQGFRQARRTAKSARLRLFRAMFRIPASKADTSPAEASSTRADAFPAQLRDQYIAANVLSNAIYWHKIERRRSSFVNRFGGDLCDHRRPFVPAGRLHGRARRQPVHCRLVRQAAPITSTLRTTGTAATGGSTDWSPTARRPCPGWICRSSRARIAAALDAPKRLVRPRGAGLMLAERRDPSVPRLRCASTAKRPIPPARSQSLWALNSAAASTKPWHSSSSPSDEDVRAGRCGCWGIGTACRAAWRRS